MVFGHMKKYVFRGALAVIPLGISLIALYFLYVLIDKRVMDLVYHYVGYKVPGLGILVVILILYVIGLVASNFLGKQMFGLLERITRKIPLIRTTYQIGQQLSMSLSLPEKQLFQRVVLLDLSQNGIWTVGFVTGTLTDQKDPGEKLLKVFVPTVPNPTSGFITIVRESRTVDPQWSVEEGMRTVISGGIIGPSRIR